MKLQMTTRGDGWAEGSAFGGTRDPLLILANPCGSR